ncbi:MAG TPA: TonB-dependent receptor [Gammaproteobacteria bacterium]|jgi:iron complex outermembrane receptor protein
MARSRPSKLQALLGTAVLACLHAGIAGAAANDSGLENLSLQELSDLPITSVSKKPEPLADAAAAVYVITNDDIRRSGVRSLEGALRLAPNLQVAQQNNEVWDISARGGNTSLADKLLILVDGRIVYTPLFGGTFWDSQNVMLEDVDRIEVTSGPGGTLWGTNAVNGVINIITRKAKDSQGALVVVDGSGHGGDVAARYGGEAGGADYRVYGTLKDNYPGSSSMGGKVADGMHIAQTGFRSDWSDFTLQGDAYQVNEDQDLPGRARFTGLNLLSHWQTRLAGGSDISVLGYYDRTDRYQPDNYGELLDIADVEFQDTLPQLGAQALVWGASYRYAMDHFQNLPGSGLLVLPGDKNLAWPSLFGQDELTLSRDWRLIGGVRLEHNPYDGNQFLPDLRLAWAFAKDDLAWAAVSRAVRSPSRIEEDAFEPSQPPFSLVGNPDFQSEVAWVYEAGLRMQPSAQWSYSVNVYHYDYNNARSLDATTLPNTPPFTFGNNLAVDSDGIEAWGTYKPLDNWRFQLGYSALHESQRLTSPLALSASTTLYDDPAEWWTLRSDYDFADGVELELNLRHVAALPNPAVPAYTVTSLRVGVDLSRQLELSVIAGNLFYGPHTEVGAGPDTAQFGRSVFVKLTWRP